MGYYSPLRLALRGVRQLLYPRRCPFCGQVLGSIPECPDCAEELETLRRTPSMQLDEAQHYMSNLQGGAAPFRYKGCVRRAVLRAKYQAAPWAAVELGVRMAALVYGSEVRMRGAEPVPQRVYGVDRVYSGIVPVPASGTKRGYNVPALMALPLSEATGVPLLRDVLRCTQKKKRQAGLPFAERLANVAGAFRVPDPEQVSGKYLILVDDVLTTGATATACTQALLDAGAMGVYVVTLATVENDSPSSNDKVCTEDSDDF